MMDENGNIRFHKIFEWMLPPFKGVSFYEFLSARIRNFMLHSIKDKGWTPITVDDVARFFGCQLARSMRGILLIERTWLTCESFNAIGTCMECMPKNVFQDIYTCLYFDDMGRGQHMG